MTYKELAEIDSTPDEDLGLNIAYKLAVNGGQTTASSPGDYLADRVRELLHGYRQERVSGEQLDRIFTAEKIAFEQNETAKLQQIATILGVSLIVEEPPGK